MTFQKNNRLGKGRVKGQPNKRSLILYNTLKDQGLDVPNRIVELMGKVDDESQLRACLELLKYMFPQRKAVDLTLDDKGTLVDLIKSMRG